MILATLSTSNFDFIALGETGQHAARAIHAAWSKHKRETGTTLSWAEVADDVNYAAIQPGEALRDGSLLVRGIR